jgi:hypothetical protein
VRLGRELELAEPIADLREIGTAPVREQLDLRRERGQIAEHLLEHAAALGDRTPSARERIHVREVVNHEDRERGREAEQDRGPRQVVDDHHAYSSMWSDSGLGLGADSGSESRFDFGSCRRRRFDTVRPTGVGSVGTGGLMRSRSVIVVPLEADLSSCDAPLGVITSRR